MRLRLATAFLFLLGPAPNALAHPNDYEGQVASWYHQYLRRDPDPIGFRDHVFNLRRGYQPRTVEAQILGSQEYYRLNGANPLAFVHALFRDVLGRPPSRGEANSWLDRLRGERRSELAQRFLEQTRGGGRRAFE